MLRADIMTIADLSDGMIFVVDVENNSRKQVLEAARDLQGKILGLTINNALRHNDYSGKDI